MHSNAYPLSCLLGNASPRVQDVLLSRGSNISRYKQSRGGSGVQSRRESEIRPIVAPSKNKPTELARGSTSGKLKSDRI